LDGKTSRQCRNLRQDPYPSSSFAGGIGLRSFPTPATTTFFTTVAFHHKTTLTLIGPLVRLILHVRRDMWRDRRIKNLAARFRVSVSQVSEVGDPFLFFYFFNIQVVFVFLFFLDFAVEERRERKSD
jgi:hypothetical protein